MTRRIAIDASLVGERVTGAGRVLTNLVRALPEIDRGSEYIALATDEGAQVLRETGARIEVIATSLRSGLLWEIHDRGRVAARANADAVLTFREIVAGGGPPVVLHLFEPPAYRISARRVRTLTDLRHATKDRVLARALQGSVRRAATVTAGSETTANWLRTRYGTSTDVVYPGIDPVFLTAEASDPTSDPPYLLHSASGDARDNTDLVLSAFARIAHRQVRLSIVSSPTALRASLQLRAEALGMADRVDIVGWVTDEELRDLYRGAVLFVHPSKYEGFAGYPALEAMALGTPVVALKAPGASEALGGVSRLVPREDAGLLADAIDALLDNDSLRGALGSAGRERAQALTWESTAAAFAAVFARLLG